MWLTIMILTNINRYSLIRQDRNTEGGGLILYVRNTLRVTILNTEMDNKTLQTEYLMCRVWGTCITPVFACLIYRPPKISYKANPCFLTDLRDHCSSYSHKIIMGDLNADLYSTNSDTIFTKKLFNELSLKVVDHKATHRPPGYNDFKTWIDVMCVDINDKILSYKNTVPPFHSRHSFIDVTIKLFASKPHLEAFSYRKFNNINPEDINGVLMSCDWSLFLEPTLDINAALECLNKNIQLAIDDLAPLKTVNPRNTKQPWINTELQLLINKRKATKNVIYAQKKVHYLLNELNFLMKLKYYLNWTEVLSIVSIYLMN